MPCGLLHVITRQGAAAAEYQRRKSRVGKGKMPKISRLASTADNLRAHDLPAPWQEENKSLQHGAVPQVRWLWQLPLTPHLQGNATLGSLNLQPLKMIVSPTSETWMVFFCSEHQETSVLKAAFLLVLVFLRILGVTDELGFLWGQRGSAAAASPSTSDKKERHCSLFSLFSLRITASSDCSRVAASCLAARSSTHSHPAPGSGLQLLQIRQGPRWCCLIPRRIRVLEAALIAPDHCRHCLQVCCEGE